MSDSNFNPHLYAIIAGEVSGDTLGAGLMKAILRHDPQARFIGIGGEKMAQCGMKSAFDMKELSVMGIFEVAARAVPILKIRSAITRMLIKERPCVMVGIDAPDFNLYVEAKLKKAGIRTIHYVSPSVWAWREKRIVKIKAACEEVLALLPFEKEFYDRHDMPCTYVGHTLANSIPVDIDQATARERCSLYKNCVDGVSARVLAILPGSRRGIITRMLPIYARTAAMLHEKMKDITFITVAPDREIALLIKDIWLENCPNLSITVFVGNTQDVIASADAALLTCGTIAFEAMLLKCPMVVAYRVSALTAAIARGMLKVSMYSLPNLLAKREIVKEMIQEDCTPIKLTHECIRLLTSDNVLMKKEFTALHESIRVNTDELAARAVIRVATRDRETLALALKKTDTALTAKEPELETLALTNSAIRLPSSDKKDDAATGAAGTSGAAGTAGGDAKNSAVAAAATGTASVVTGTIYGHGDEERFLTMTAPVIAIASGSSAPVSLTDAAADAAGSRSEPESVSPSTSGSAAASGSDEDEQQADSGSASADDAASGKGKKNRRKKRKAKDSKADADSRSASDSAITAAAASTAAAAAIGTDAASLDNPTAAPAATAEVAAAATAAAADVAPAEAEGPSKGAQLVHGLSGIASSVAGGVSSAGHSFMGSLRSFAKTMRERKAERDVIKAERAAQKARLAAEKKAREAAEAAARAEAEAEAAARAAAAARESAAASAAATAQTGSAGAGSVQITDISASSVKASVADAASSKLEIRSSDGSEHRSASATADASASAEATSAPAAVTSASSDSADATSAASGSRSSDASGYRDFLDRTRTASVDHKDSKSLSSAHKTDISDVARGYDSKDGSGSGKSLFRTTARSAEISLRSSRDSDSSRSIRDSRSSRDSERSSRTEERKDRSSRSDLSSRRSSAGDDYTRTSFYDSRDIIKSSAYDNSISGSYQSTADSSISSSFSSSDSSLGSSYGSARVSSYDNRDGSGGAWTSRDNFTDSITGGSSYRTSSLTRDSGSRSARDSRDSSRRDSTRDSRDSARSWESRSSRDSRDTRDSRSSSRDSIRDRDRERDSSSSSRSWERDSSRADTRSSQDRDSRSTSAGSSSSSWRESSLTRSSGSRSAPDSYQDRPLTRSTSSRDSRRDLDDLGGRGGRRKNSDVIKRITDR